MKNITKYGFFLIFILIFISSCDDSEKKDSDNDETTDLSNDADNDTDTTSDEDSGPVYEMLDAAAAKDLINARKDDPAFHIIDVRSPSEFETGHIANAENYNVYDAGFSDNITGFKREDAYFVYCASGNRSKGAITTMKDMGFLELYELNGGITSWKNAGYPTETE
jgi:rhodanese-related sulfurtransferase